MTDSQRSFDGAVANSVVVIIGTKIDCLISV